MLVLTASTHGVYSRAEVHTHLATCIHADVIVSKIRVSSHVHKQS